jgi:hypothetical protein
LAAVVITPAVLVVLGLSACAGGSTTVTDGDPGAGSAPDLAPEFEADQADIERARFEQAHGRARWEAEAVTGYTMTVGYVGVGMVEVAVEDGQPVSTTILAEPNQREWLANAGLPSTVDEAFDQVDTLIDAASAPGNNPDGNCDARYFTARWDPELGYPEYFDGLGPCEDGVGVSITVIAE